MPENVPGLKIRWEDFQKLQDSVLKVREKVPKGRKTVSRYVWDVLWQSEFGNDSKSMNLLYEYLNDDNIESALKRILLYNQGK